MSPVRRPGSHRMFFALVLLAAAAAAWWALLPGGPFHAAPDPLLAGLPPDLQSILAANDDDALAEWGREAGFEKTRQAAWHLVEVASELPLETYTRRLPEIDDYRYRLARFLAREFDGRYYLDDLAFLDRLAPAEQQRILRRRRALTELRTLQGMEPGEKIEILHSWLAEAEQDGDRVAVAGCLFSLSHFYSYLEDRPRQREYLEAALDAYLALGAHVMSCQALGVLGDLHESAGEDQEMIRCYEQARRLADRGRLPDQAGRINAFYAAYYRRAGNLALAHDLYHEAIRSCREFKGGTYELRYLCTAMDFYADLSAWDIVAGFLDRARGTMAFDPDGLYTARYADSVRQLEARLAMAQGRVEEGDSAYRELSLRLGDAWSRVAPVENYRLWSEGLLENRRPDRALEVALQGRSLARKALLPGQEARLALVAARAEHQRGRPEEAVAQLADFDRLRGQGNSIPPEEHVARDELIAHLAWERGDTTAAVRLAAQALGRLGDRIQQMGPSTHGYLWIERCDGVRLLWHALADADPWAGYGLEFVWRDLRRSLGREARRQDARRAIEDPAAGGGDPAGDRVEEISLSRLAAHGRALADRLERSGAPHCLYAEDGEKIRRWFVQSGDMRCETLAITASEAEELVRRVRELLPGDGGAGAAGGRTVLRELAVALLPPEILAPPASDSPSLLLVTVGGPLSALPFEMLDLGTGADYEPLLQRWDTAYLRHADPPATTTAEWPGVVVANSEVLLGAGQRSPFAPRLEEVAAECRAVAGHDPRIRLLDEEAATKSEVQRVWERAGFLYFATHVARDPRTPYLVSIPLAAPDTLARVESLHLTLEDIRRARFDACRLVVLSGCASGLPYVTAFSAGPSLGDAFLDAGAAAVVQTFWDVPDPAARAQMTSFADRWLGKEESPVHALAEVKRAAQRAAGDADFDWATYAVGISRLDGLR